MAKPASRALDLILARHPTATVVERDERSLTADVGGGKRALVSQIGAMHYDDGGWQAIDTAWQPTAGAWQYEMTTAPYQAYARDMLNAGNVVEYQAKTGEGVTFQPLALNWRDINNSQQQIAIPQAVATQVTGTDLDVLSWPNGYGAGRHLTWIAHPTRLQKLLTIDTAGDLPAPAGYLGADVHLEMTFAFTVDASVDVYVDGALWDKSSTLTTASHIEFRNVGGDTLWAFQQPKAWDSAGSETLGTMRVYQSGALHVAVRIPRAFVDAAVFPLFIDPTVDSAIANGADDGYVRKGSSEFASTSNNLQVGYWEETNEQAVWLRFSGLSVPAGATVSTADISLTHIDNNGGDFSVLIQGQDSLNPAAPTNVAGFEARTTTTATVVWTAPSAVGYLGAHTTADIGSIVQELFDLGAATAVMFYLDANFTWPGVTTTMRWCSYENTAGSDPTLYVEYSTGTPVTLSPDGTVSASGIEDQAAGTTDLHLAIDDSPDASDADTTYLVNSGSATGTAWVTLSNTPSDFDEMVTLSVRVRARQA